MLRVVRFEPTPNPRALKAALDRPVPPPPPGVPSPRSYRAASAATADPLAHALLEIPGVSAVLLGDSWITINRDETASWSVLKPAIERVLGHFEASA